MKVKSVDHAIFGERHMLLAAQTTIRLFSAVHVGILRKKWSHFLEIRFVCGKIDGSTWGQRFSATQPSMYAALASLQRV